MSSPKGFHIDINRFRKRLIIRTVSIFLINFILLGWTVYSAPRENLINYFGLCSFLLLVIGLFLFKNFKKQISILKNNYLEINSHILQSYIGSEQCTTINLKRVHKIERDTYRGFERFLIFEEEIPEIILNLKEPEEFQKEIEHITNLKVEIFTTDWRILSLKGLSFFFPAFIGILCTYLKYLDIRYFFLILTLNSIFFLIQFSEKRIRGGMNETTVRRSQLILILLLAYQIFILVTN